MARKEGRDPNDAAAKVADLLAPPAPPSPMPPTAAAAMNAAASESDEAFALRMRLAKEAKNNRDALRGHFNGDNLAELNASARARSEAALATAQGPTSVTEGLPNVVRRAAGLKVRNPPVHHAQIKPIPGEIDTEGFLAAVRAIPVQPLLSNKTRMAVARAIVWGLGKAPLPELAVRGVSQLSYSSLTTAAECSRAQVWRAIRLFESRGLLDTWNVLVREGNYLLRSANAYVLRGFTKAVPALVEAVKDVVTGAFDRISEQLRRFAGVWDVRPNHIGRPRSIRVSRIPPSPS
jgi:hypothetical protein